MGGSVWSSLETQSTTAVDGINFIEKKISELEDGIEELTQKTAWKIDINKMKGQLRE